MSARFVNIDHDTPLLLPPDLRDWVSSDHMVHFIMEAVAALDLGLARVNERGTGSAQYPPSMMLGLLIYCYATGTFASRRIETLTYENVAVRYLTGDTHPDHDSICKFRRENKDLLSHSFHQVLELAARQAKEQSTGKKPGGKPPAPPQEGPRDADQYNHTDPESRIMKVRGGFEQSYNAQAAVEVASMLIVGQHVTHQANDKQQLLPTLAVISPVVGQVTDVLVDSGYYSENAILTAETGDHKPTVYAAMKRQKHGRSIAQLEAREDPPAPPEDATVAERMAHRLDTAQGKQIYGLRKQTVEPVFGIIKQAIGFRRFLLRGKEKARKPPTFVRTKIKQMFQLRPRRKPRQHNLSPQHAESRPHIDLILRCALSPTGC